MTCTVCRRPVAWSGRGRKPTVCGARCRKRRQRATLPVALTGLRRWAVADGKRPMRPDGRAASSTDRKTWVPFSEVADCPHGIMLGDGLACFDLDDVIAGDGSLHPDAVEVLTEVADPIWVERSMSGRGLHVFVHSYGPTRQSDLISFYSWGRFIVVTGNRYHSRLLTRNGLSQS